MKNIYLLLICFLLIISKIHSQEQVSFVYDNLNSSTYKFMELYEFNGEARMMSAEKNGEIIISALDGNTQDTILQVNESITDFPYNTQFSGNHLVQYFEDKLVITNINSLVVTIRPIPIPQRQHIRILNENFLIIGLHSDTINTAIRLSDMNEYQIPKDLIYAASDDVLYNYYFSNNPVDLVVYNINSEQLDTIYQVSTSFSSKIKDDYMYIEEGLEVYRYDLNNNVFTLMYSYESTNNNGFLVYEDEVIFYENINTTSLFNITDLEGMNFQTYIFPDTLQKRIRQVVLKDANGEYLLQDLNADLFQTLGLVELKPLDEIQSFDIFPESSDSTLIYIDDRKVQSYDPITKEIEILDSIKNDFVGFGYNGFVKIDNQLYVQNYSTVFANGNNTSGLDIVEYRIFRPYGVSRDIDFFKTENNLYLQDNNDIYFLQSDTFRQIEGTRSIPSDLIPYQDEIYFAGRTETAWGLFKISADQQLIELSENAKDATKSQNEDFLLLKVGASFIGPYLYALYDLDQANTTFLDFVPEINFNFLRKSIGSSFFLESEQNDTVTIWQLDAVSNTLTPIVDVADRILPFIVEDKLIFKTRDFDGTNKIIFWNHTTQEMETFVPPNNGLDYQMAIFYFNCDNSSLLFEVYYNDNGEREIWSTDGTLENTILQIENAVHVDGGYGDFAIHGDLEQLYFSIKTSETTYDHYYYDCSTMTMQLEPYPDDMVLTRRFKVGDTLFGITSKDPVNGHSLVNLTDVSNVSYDFSLGKYKNESIFFGLGTGRMHYVSQGLHFGDDNRALAVLSIDPFGQELCYVYEDGTVEMLFDINEGIANAFFVEQFFLFYKKEIQVASFGDYFYFDAHSRPTGHQIYRIERNGMLSKNNTITLDPIVVNLFPNPTQNYLNVELDNPKNSNWKIISVNGNILMEGKTSQNMTSIDISKFSTGMYYFYIEINGRRLVKGFNKI